MLGSIALLLVGCTREPQAAFDPIAILVTPDRPVVSLGQRVQLTATGADANRESADLTALAEWYADDPSIAAVSNDLDAEGRVEGIATGETQVWAVLGDVASVPVTVQVTEAELVALTVHPDDVEATVGDRVPLEVEAVFSDGLRTEANAQVRWVTGDGEIAQLSAAGELSAIAEGQTEVYASWDDVRSDEVPVTVREAPANAMPDLRIENVVARMDTGKLIVDFQVRNAGNSGASDFWVDLFVDPAGAPVVGDTGSEFVNAGYAGPGQSVDISYTTAVGSGSHTFAILADSTNAIVESDESNNLHEQTLAEVAPTEPDLAVTRFVWVTDASDIYFEATIKNLGGSASEGFLFEFYTDRARAPTPGTSGESYEWFEELAVGDSVTVDGFVRRACNPCRSWAVADLDDLVDESNEANNAIGPVNILPDDDGEVIAD